MMDQTLKLVGTGALALGLVTATTACSTAVPTEGSGEMQQLEDAGPGLAGEMEELVTDRAGDEGWSLEVLEPVTEYENVSTDTIRVQVDRAIPSDERERIAESLFAVAADAGSPLATVLIQDPEGDETEHRG